MAYETNSGGITGKDGLRGEFEEACRDITEKTARLDELKQHFYAGAQMSGSDDTSIGGLNINTSGRNSEAAMLAKKRKESADDFILLAMLDQIDAQVAASEAYFNSEYGSQYVDTMAGLYLTEGQQAGLNSRDEKLQALFDEYLTPDGKTRDKYKDTKAGRDVQKLYEMEEARELGVKIRRDGPEAHMEKIEQVLGDKNPYTTEKVTATAQNSELNAMAEKSLDKDDEAVRIAGRQITSNLDSF